MIKQTILSLMLLFLPAVSLWAVTAEDAAARLATLGFENVRVAEQGDHIVYAAFEAVSYRGTYRGAAVGIA